MEGVLYRNEFRIKTKHVQGISPGSFLGLRRGMNLAPIANAIAGPNMKPLASIPGGNKKQVRTSSSANAEWKHEWAWHCQVVLIID
jgi:hypothetical protein